MTERRKLLTMHGPVDLALLVAVLNALPTEMVDRSAPWEQVVEQIPSENGPDIAVYVP